MTIYYDGTVTFKDIYKAPGTEVGFLTFEIKDGKFFCASWFGDISGNWNVYGLYGSYGIK